MLEKRNPIRRNLTGGLALGFFTGLLLALPDAVAGLIEFPGLSLWSAVVLLFFFDGVITAGLLGFARGLLQAAALKFTGSAAQSLAWTVWSRRTLAALWASSIMPALPLSRSVRWFVTLGLALAAAWVLPEIVRRLGAAAEDRRSKSPVILAACAAMAGGFYCTSHWGAIRLFSAPGFWFLTAFFLHLGALFFLARLVRTHSRYHAIWLSPLAGPGVVSIVLLVAMLGGSFARTRLDRADPAQLKAFSLLAHGLHGGQDVPAVSPAAQAAEAGLDSGPGSPVMPVAPKPALATLHLDFQGSFLIVTSTVSPAPAFDHGFRVTGGVAASSDLVMSLGSFFTGRHLGMWGRLAPHWPAPGPSWHQAIAAHHRIEAVRYGRFDGASGPYFRELPDFGFPEAFEVDQEPQLAVSPLQAFLRTTDLVSRPFFAWVHLGSNDPGVTAVQMQKAATDGRYTVIWLHLPAAGAATVSVYDPARTAAAVDFEAPFSVAGVLPSLLPVPGQRTEFSSAPFPEVRHPRVTVDRGSPPSGSEHDVRRLTRRIRHAVSRRPSERAPSTPEKLASYLDTLICRGQIEPAEVRRVLSRVKPYPNRRDLAERIDLLNWRLGRLKAPPSWTARVLAEPWKQVWRQFAQAYRGANDTGGGDTGGENTGGGDTGGENTGGGGEVIDARVLAWTLALSGGGITGPLVEICPGVQHSLPLLPGL